MTGAGGEGNLLEPKPQSCRQIALDMPVIANEELAKLKRLEG
jgi:glutamate synthase (ferredoxin)